jgi:hypothetical protein
MTHDLDDGTSKDPGVTQRVETSSEEEHYQCKRGTSEPILRLCVDKEIIVKLKAAQCRALEASGATSQNQERHCLVTLWSRDRTP